MPKKHNFLEIEKKWQKRWRREGVYEPDMQRAKNPFYNLMMFPYPSAEGLHVGNVYAFTGADIYGRFKRMQGNDVFEPIGLDGFGIHSENYALKVGTHPMKQSKVSERRFYQQLAAIGNGFAWSNRLETYDPEYYKWTQWIFLQLFKAGLAYRKKQSVNWCPSCKTVLADEQVVKKSKIKNQKSKLEETVLVCERCETPVVKKELEQWFFRITNYAERLLKNLDLIDWSEKVKVAQRNWIGKSEGAEINFQIPISKLQSKGKLGERMHFDPKLIPEILTGTKTVTFRMNSKKVREGQLVELADAETRRVFAVAKVEKVKKIPLGKLSLDYPGHEKDGSEEERRARYSRYYSRPIKDTDPVWIYHFLPISLVVPVFTTRPDTLFGATYMVLAPEHPLLKNLKSRIKNIGEVKKYVQKATKKSEEERVAENKEKTGVELKGVKAVNPASGEKIPVWVADYVLGGYGTGAIMAVPAHDERDLGFSRKYKLPVKMVVCPNYPEPKCPAVLDRAYAEPGHLVDSGRFNGMPSEKAKWEITKFVGGQKKVQYRLRDWLISRQRYWGPPIPLVFCEACKKRAEAPEFSPPTGGRNPKRRLSLGERENPGWVPVPEDKLPVKLPFVKNFRPTGTGKSPLASVRSFYETKCPRCGGPARRETDVSDTFLDSAWYHLRYPTVGDKHAAKEAWEHALTRKWLPVDMYIGGAEHSVLHLLYVRFLAMVFHDIGLLEFEEPFPKFRAHGLLIKDSAKMSKSRGNVVNPDEYLKKFGADVLRMHLMFIAPLEAGGDFRGSGIVGIVRFLSRVWSFEFSHTFKKSREAEPEFIKKLLHKTIKQVSDDIEALKYNTAISALMILFGELFQHGASQETWSAFLKLLAPFAPHVAEEIWREGMLKEKFSIHASKWPVFNPEFVREKTFTLVVQVNGKVRDSVEVPAGISEKEAERLALAREKVTAFLNGARPRRVIYVPGRLVNLVV